MSVCAGPDLVRRRDSSQAYSDMHWRLRVLLDAAVLLLLLASDARDLWYKTQWLGPGDAFAFSTRNTLRAVNFRDSNQLSAESTTGWRAFHATCSDLHALIGNTRTADGHSHFLHVLARNCSAPEGLTEDMAPELQSMVLTSDVRADAMAWAACQLLSISRRPPQCQDTMVTGFLERYRFDAPRVTSAMIAAPVSNAERELLALLDVIGKSLVLSNVVCVSGVELPVTDSQQDSDSLRRVFGCASPNLPGRSAAFVGQYATAFADLQLDKTRLTVDDVDILGMHFVFRQNAIRSYSYSYHPGTPIQSEQQSAFPGHMDVRTALNLNCSGFLYDVMVLTDVVLLALHAWSAAELLSRYVLSHLVRTPTKKELRDLEEGERRTTFFMCSLVHSTPVAMLMLTSALLSWLLLLPHAAVWTLSSDEASYSVAELHTLLSALRVWVLLLLLVHALWSILVFIDEGRAYMLATRTCASSVELVGAVAFAGILLRPVLVSVLLTKHDMERQRVTDGAAFPGQVVVSNAFEDLTRAVSPRTQNSILWMIYTPLIELLLLSLLVVGLGMAVRYFLHNYRRRVAAASAAAAVGVDKTTDGSRASSAHGFSTAQAMIAGYKRLPLEELLDVPIRAKHIIRSGGPGGLERTVNAEQYLWTVQYLSHGVLLENDRFLSVRRGFCHALPLVESIDARVGSETTATEDNGSPKRRRYAVNALQ